MRNSRLRYTTVSKQLDRPRLGFGGRRDPFRDYARPLRQPFSRHFQRGAAGWILLWLLGIPVPILVVLFLLRGCT